MSNAQSGDPLKYTTPKFKKKQRMYCFIYCSEKKLPYGYVALCFHKIIFPRATEFVII